MTQNLDELVEPYKKPDTKSAIIQILNTSAALATLCYLMYVTVEISYALTLLLSIPAGALIVRFFIIQHDCGHGSFTKSKKMNDFIGRAVSVLTLTPYYQWAKEHDRHHATSGNLNFRGVGDVTTLTVKEYQNSSVLQKFWYRIYRHPLFLFTAGAVIHFVFKQRLPLYKPKRLKSWISVMGNNLYIAVVYISLSNILGLELFLKLYIPMMFVAASLGTWIFYCQHQFEDTYWEKADNWSYQDAAIKGSAYYDLPRIAHWFSGNIGYHHIHHLSSKIPNYKLPACFEENEVLQTASHRYKFWESLKCANVALWDEKKKKMVAFRDLSVANSI